MLLFCLAPCLAILCMILIHTYSSHEKVVQNWEDYRCHPLYMPFVTFFKSDVNVSDNFNHCMNRMGNDFLKTSLDPINALFGTINSSLAELVSPLTLFRSMFSKLRKFMLSFTAVTFSKITNSTSSLVHILIKIRDLLQRFVGEGYIAAFLANTFVEFIMGFVYLCMSIIKTFVYALLAISIILALFQPELLAVAVMLASLIAASGF